MFKYIPFENGKPVKAWVSKITDDDGNAGYIEVAAMQQLENVARLPFIHRHVAVMPDVHMGYGATVGSVIPTRGAIVPSAVGVDIGCGMMAVRTDVMANDLPDNLAELRTEIEATVPHGRSNNGQNGDCGSWVGGSEPSDVLRGWSSLAEGHGALCHKHPEVVRANALNHLGTLGTGNHFIEVCVDEADGIWLMLHSGSRGIGNRIGNHFIEKAQTECAKWFIDLPERDLAFFPEGTPGFDEYTQAVAWAQTFALVNREVMMARVLTALSRSLRRTVSALENAVNCHHNYVEREHHYGADVWVTRKGAVRAGKGELGIIPGSMGAKSFIVRGLGNKESFLSCSHGAGRAMSRTKAKKHFSLDDHIKATAHVECRKDPSVIDETPGAYKSIEAVMEAQRDLVEVVHTLRQVVCVKG